MCFNYDPPAALFRSRFHPDIACSMIEKTSVVLLSINGTFTALVIGDIKKGGAKLTLPFE
jgi:hypothetical protein